MKRPQALALAVLALVAWSGCSEGAERDEEGAITEEGKVDAFKVKVGDCINLPDAEAETATSVTGVPCEEAHDFEAFHIFDLEGDDLPSTDEIAAAAVEACTPAFEEYVGTALESSELDFLPELTPSEESWKEGDREVVCGVSLPDEASPTGRAKLTGSVKSSGR